MYCVITWKGDLKIYNDILVLAVSVVYVDR